MADEPPPQHPSPHPPSKRPKHDQELLTQMWSLLWLGAHLLVMLWVVQMATQQASGVMVVAMLCQQGAMREVLAWESEVECVMREMARRVEGEESDL